MKTIRERAETAMAQALLCVQYRLPGRKDLKPNATCLALALRYGLIGAAAAGYVFDYARDDDERILKDILREWPDRVMIHFEDSVSERLAFDLQVDASLKVARLSHVPLRLALSMREQMFSLPRALEVSAEMFTRDHREPLLNESFILQRKKVMRMWETVASDSVQFAVNFYERRHEDLDEVPEIALIGE